jgi:hypothetical protein
VYTIWFSMLGGDSRSAWRSGALPDRRVTHLWDEQRLAAQWFSRHVEQTEGLVWDTYMLYGPDATWANMETAPEPLISSGATVVNKRAELESSLLPLLDGEK